MIGEKFGRFRITAPLGKGGMASVWRAEDPLLGRDVALKIIAEDLARSPGARARFRVEAENGRKLDHPGIVPVIDYAERAEEDRLWIAFGLVEGDTLSDRIARAPMDPREAARIVADAAEAIAHAHERGVLHRDVSTRNIMVGNDGRVFVLDFGLSRALDQESFTSSGVLMGTPHFLAPEVIRGERATEATDVWGLGVALYEALTGRLPFRYSQREALLHAIVNDDAEAPSRIREGLDAVCDGLLAQVLAKEWRARPRITALRERLDELQGTTLATARAMPRSARTLGPSAREVSRIFLAVMPFEDGEASTASGLAAAICSALTAVQNMTVIPLESIVPGASLEEIALRIGANRCLSGEVRRNGAQVRVTWRVIDPFTRVQIAGDSVDGISADPFTLEDRVIRGVVSVFDIQGAPTEAMPRAVPAAEEKYLQAIGYLHRHDHEASVDGAISILERLATSTSAAAKVFASLGRAYLAKWRLTHEHEWEGRAASACDKALRIDSDSVEALSTLGEIHLETGHQESALETFDAVLDRQPSLEAWIGRGRALEGLLRFEEAEAALRRGIAFDSNAWNGYQWLGLLQFRRGRFNEAISSWRAALDRSPGNARTLANLGAAWFQLGRFEEAIVACRDSVRSAPTPRAFSNLGTALVYLARYEEGIEALEKAVALQPRAATHWGNLGSACRLAGREARAREATTHAISLARMEMGRQPRDLRLRAQLAVWLTNLQKFEDARIEIERVLVEGTVDSEILATAVRVFQVADPDRAIYLLRQAVKRGYMLERFLLDPSLSPLHQLEAFQEAVRQITIEKEAASE